MTIEATVVRPIVPLECGGLSGAPFYLSNLGMFPVVHSSDAVVAVSAAAMPRVAGEDGERSSCSPNCDHRVLAGADAARFLTTLAEYLAKPGQLTETEP